MPQERLTVRKIREIMRLKWVFNKASGWQPGVAAYPIALLVIM